MPEPNVVTPAVAAKEKRCTAAAIHLAGRREELTAHRFGGTVLVMRDDRYDAYQVLETGGRLHRRYKAGQEDARCGK